MKDKIRALSMSVIIGIGLGMPVTLLCMISIGGYQSFMKEVIVWMVASAFYGLLSTVIFGSLKFSLIVSTVLHCIGCLAVTIGAGAICGYGDNIVQLILGLLPVFVVVYVVIYGISIINMKIQAKKVNDALSKKN